MIGGYLGAGKTTLLNHVLHNSRDRRIAVLVNDFGSINIDAGLIENEDENTIALNNGCICCSLAGGFVLALTKIRERAEPPEQVLVEASGVADPHKIGQYGHMPGYRPDGVIVVADSEAVRAQATDEYMGAQVRQQLRGADLLVLNKTDLVVAQEHMMLRCWLRELEPDARILGARHGAVPLKLLLGDPPSPPRHHGHGVDGRDHHHDLDYEMWSYESDESLDGSNVRAFVAGLPEGIIRAKGILQLREAPEYQTILHLVGKRWSLKTGEPWGRDRPRTQLVLIGLPGSIEEDWLERTLCGQEK